MENRFKDAGYGQIKFIAYTNNETNAALIRQNARNLTVVVLNLSNDSPFALFDLRSVYIFDNCGQLVYTVYYPWSNIFRPFVKAAILSTIYDEPCGCNVCIK